MALRHMLFVFPQQQFNSDRALFFNRNAPNANKNLASWIHKIYLFSFFSQIISDCGSMCFGWIMCHLVHLVHSFMYIHLMYSDDVNIGTCTHHQHCYKYIYVYHIYIYEVCANRSRKTTRIRIRREKNWRPSVTNHDGKAKGDNGRILMWTNRT